MTFIGMKEADKLAEIKKGRQPDKYKEYMEKHRPFLLTLQPENSEDSYYEYIAFFKLLDKLRKASGS